jgi:lipopolysaccharide export system permease protein
MGVVQEAAKNGLGAQQIFKILPYIVPSLLPFTIPATLLLTVCIVYGRMAGDHEIGAIKAAGINVLAVLVPSFVLGAVLSLGTFILTDQFIPWARANIEHVVAQEMEDIFLDLLRTNSSYHDLGHGISINVASVEERRLINPIFRYRLANGDVATVTARQATIQFDMREQQVLLDFVDGHIETPGGNNGAIAHERLPFPMPVAADSLKAPRNMTIDNIRRELSTIDREKQEVANRQIIKSVLALSAGAFDRLVPRDQEAEDYKDRLRTERFNRLRTEIHGRTALACSCIFFVLIGSPVAIIKGRRQFLTNFAICFLPILVGYYPVVILTMDLCRGGRVDPTWGMWVGNLGLAAAAAYMLHRVMKN